jgi:hypothetical protein
MFTPLFTPIGVITLYCLEEWRGKQRILPPGDNFTRTQGTKFTPGVTVCPRGEVKNGPLIFFLSKFLCNTRNFLATSFLISETAREVYYLRNL